MTIGKIIEDEIRELIEQGENMGVEFKSARVRPEALAREMVVRIAKGQFKPYQTIDGKYWIRVGSTNRTATKEE